MVWGKGNEFYHINLSRMMNGCTCKVGRGGWVGGGGVVVGLVLHEVVNMTVVSLWDCQRECTGRWGKEDCKFREIN